MIFFLSFYDLRSAGPFPLGSQLCTTKESSEFFMCFVSGHIVVLTQNSSMWPQLLSTEVGYRHPTKYPFGLSLAPTPFLLATCPSIVHTVPLENGLSSRWLHPRAVPAEEHLDRPLIQTGSISPFPGNSELGPNRAPQSLSFRLNLKGSGFVNRHLIITWSNPW